ncbi:MAG: adenylate/guanylate cyclase domain-containing protein [Ignavibacteriales bacterium]|nr:adenylate/guanylate cyclase domain-containing protein [Ignavibacteriales bacterium]
MTISKNRTFWATAQLAVASFLFVHFLFWAFPAVFESWNSQIIDRLFVARSLMTSFGPRYDSTVVHVDLSDNTIATLRNFYLTRTHYAQVIRNLGSMGAAAQAWDYIFPGHTTLEEDRAFVEAAHAAGNAYFGMKFNLYEDAPVPPMDSDLDYVRYLDQTSWVVHVDGDPSSLYDAGNPIATMPEIAMVSRGLGYLSLKFDPDGVFRRAPLLVRYKDRFYPSFALRVSCDYLGVTPDRILLEPGRRILLRGARRPGFEPRDIDIPIDGHANIVINWAGPWETMLHYDFGDILRASDDRDEMEIFGEELGGKIVVVSEVATGSADVGPVPTDNNFPLSGLHANVIFTIVNAEFMRHIGGAWMLAIEFGILVLLLLLALRLSSRSLSLSTLAILGAFLLIAAGLFFASVIINILRPVLIVLLGMFSIVAYRYFNEEKNKEVLRRSFEAYFPPAVVRRIMANPNLITAAGQKKELTIMFSDIKSFTTYSSVLPADEIQKLLNEYFEAMVDIVFKYEGTVDKFIGDGLMVFFGDPEPQPDHAVRCVRAAIEMQKKTRLLREEWERKGRFPIRIRIGINTGPVVVGNMGSARRLSYTVLGSDVNLAQRLESSAPVEGIMISQRTYELVKDHVVTRPMDPVKPKGLDTPIQVWEVVVGEGSY